MVSIMKSKSFLSRATVRKIIISVFILLVFVQVASASLIWQDGYETGDFSNWGSRCTIGANQQSTDADRYHIASYPEPVRDGNYSVRIRVYDDTADCWGASNAERTEFMKQEGLQFDDGSEAYYVWSFYLPTDFVHVSAWSVVTQVHGYAPTSPNWAINMLNDDSLRMSVCTGASLPTRSCSFQTSYSAVPTLTRAKWHDFILYAKYRKNATGQLKLWHKEQDEANYTLVRNVTNIITLQWDSTNPVTKAKSLQQGFYRGSQPEMQEVYYDSAKVVSTWEEAIANSLIAPAIIDWNNSKFLDNRTSLTINVTESVNYSVIADQSITTWNWLKDGESQTNNYSYFNVNFSTTGGHTIAVSGTNSNGTSNTITWNINVLPIIQNPSCVGVNCADWGNYSTGNHSYFYNGIFHNGIFLSNYSFLDGANPFTILSGNITISNGDMVSYGVSSNQKLNVDNQTNVSLYFTLNESVVDQVRSFEIRADSSRSNLGFGNYVTFWGDGTVSFRSATLVNGNVSWYNLDMTSFARSANVDNKYVFVGYGSNLKLYNSTISYDDALSKDPLISATDGNYTWGNLISIYLGANSTRGTDTTTVSDIRVFKTYANGTTINTADRVVSYDSGIGNVTGSIVLENCVALSGNCSLNYGEKNHPLSTVNASFTGDLTYIPSTKYRYPETQIILNGDASADNITFTSEVAGQSSPSGGVNGTVTQCTNGCNLTWLSNATLVNYSDFGGTLTLPSTNPAMDWWNANEGAADTIAIDSNMTNKRNLTHTGGVTRGVIGKYGYGVTDDGSTGYSINSTGISSGNAGTMAIWLKPTNWSKTSSYIMAAQHSAGDGKRSHYNLFARYPSICPIGDWGIVLSNGVSTNQIVCSGQVFNSANFSSSAWNYITVTFNGSRVVFYTNGVQIKSVAQTITAGNATKYPFAIGRDGGYGGNSNYYYAGSWDEAIIDNYAYTQQQILSAMNGTLTQGDIITYVDVGSGNETYQIGTEATGSYSLSIANNATLAYSLIGNYSGTQTILIPNASRFQNTNFNITGTTAAITKIIYYWQSTSSQGGSYQPPAPTNMICSNDFSVPFGIYSWSCGWNSGTGNITDYYDINYTIDGVTNWVNDTPNEYITDPGNVIKHSNITISVFAGNSTFGINNTPAISSFQITNQPVTISNISDEYNTYEGASWYADADCTDGDNPVDTCIFASDSSNVTINSATGVMNWTTVDGNEGNYTILVNVTDNNGSIAQKNFLLAVVSSNPTLFDLSNYTYNSESVNYAYIFFDWNATHSDNRQVLFNGTDAGTVNDTDYTSSLVLDNTAANISVREYNSSINEYTAWSNMTVNVSIPPLPPDNLTNQTATKTSVVLNWNASTETDFSGIYEVFQDGVHIAYPATNSYAVTGLTASTNYTFAVRANDTYGNWGANSSDLNVTTESTTPSLTSLTLLASNNIHYNNLAEVSTSNTDYTKLLEIAIPSSVKEGCGTINVTYDLRSSAGGTVWGKARWNNTDITGTETSTTSSTYVTKTTNASICLSGSDTYSVWGKRVTVGNSVFVTKFSLAYDGYFNITSGNTTIIVKATNLSYSIQRENSTITENDANVSTAYFISQVENGVLESSDNYDVSGTISNSSNSISVLYNTSAGNETITWEIVDANTVNITRELNVTNSTKLVVYEEVIPLLTDTRNDSLYPRYDFVWLNNSLAANDIKMWSPYIVKNGDVSGIHTRYARYDPDLGVIVSSRNRNQYFRLNMSGTASLITNASARQAGDTNRTKQKELLFYLGFVNRTAYNYTDLDNPETRDALYWSIV